jgi:hypothetical protein
VQVEWPSAAHVNDTGYPQKLFATLWKTGGQARQVAEHVVISMSASDTRSYGGVPGHQDRIEQGCPQLNVVSRTASFGLPRVIRIFIQSGALAIWMEKSNEPDVELVPKNVLHAAARCPLIRVENEAGFDTETFRRFALGFAAGG